MPSPATLCSMTGAGSAAGTAPLGAGQIEFAWDIRSVNGRGLDLRFRLPNGFDRLEPDLRAAAASRLKRGTVTATLTIAARAESRPQIDRALLAEFATEIDLLAATRPGSPAPRLELLLALPGVLRREAAESAAPDAATQAAIAAGFAASLDGLTAFREAEGARLGAVLGGLFAQFASLHQDAAAEAPRQREAQAQRLRTQLETLLAGRAGMPEERLAQEIALLATRADVTEEIDRLASHLEGARAMLAAGGAAGRQLDFLIQEFLRETNTLCSESASIALTRTGLAMKALIEQIREQVQNLE